MKLVSVVLDEFIAEMYTCNSKLPATALVVSFKPLLGLFASGFGFNIRGGVDHPHVGSDPGIFITTVRADSVSGKDGRLEPGDRILAVSSTSCTVQDLSLNKSGWVWNDRKL